MAAMISAPLALVSARAAVRGAKVQQKVSTSAKVVRSAARAEMSKGEKAAAVAAVTIAAAPAAQASELGEDLFTIFDSIDKAADKVEGAFGILAGAAGKVGSAINAVTPVVKPLAERVANAAAPIEDAAVKYAERTIVPVAIQAEKAAEGAAGQALRSAEDAIKAQGIDVRPAEGAISQAASFVVDAASGAAPLLSDFGDFLTAASPTDLVEVAVGAAAVYLLTPVLLKTAAASVRGFAGSIRPVEAYDAVLSGGNIVVLDVRRENEASRGDIEFPRRYSNKVLTVPREKLSGNFKNMGDVESNLTALKMASLKGIKKSTKVLLLDSNGSEAPKLAKALSTQGFSKVFVIEGGFAGWQKAGLGVKAARSVSATLLPSFGGSSSSGSSSVGRVIDVTPTRGFLPSGRD